MEKNPNDIGALLKIAHAFYNLNQFKEASSFYKKALENDPENPIILTSLGATLLGLRQHDKAIPLLEKAFKLDGEHVDTINNLGHLF